MGRISFFWCKNKIKKLSKNIAKLSVNCRIKLYSHAFDRLYENARIHGIYISYCMRVQRSYKEACLAAMKARP